MAPTRRGMSVRIGLVALVGLLGASFGPEAASAQTEPDTPSVVEDAWFGSDKVLHFGVSAALAAGGYALGTRMFEGTGAAVGFGSVVALGAGGLKEWSDSRGSGTASWRDMAWNVVGTGVGVGVAYLIDRSRSNSVRTEQDQFGSLTASTLPRWSRALPINPYTNVSPVMGSVSSLTTMACAPSLAASFLIPSICVGNSATLAGVGR